MPWEPYKLGINRYVFESAHGPAAEAISENFQRIADLLEAADNGGIDVMALAAEVAALQRQLERLQQYVHVQMTPAATWMIAHNLGRYPQVMILDSLGDVVEGDIRHLNADTVRASFGGAFSGKAVLT